MYHKQIDYKLYDGFEIYIGNQSDINFWEDFFTKIGKIDILLDDGGHGNAQQVVTLNGSINNINDDGIIVVEDVHSSYLKKFGNPSKNYFINYSKYLIDIINLGEDSLISSFEFSDYEHKYQYPLAVSIILLIISNLLLSGKRR